MLIYLNFTILPYSLSMAKNQILTRENPVFYGHFPENPV